MTPFLTAEWRSLVMLNYECDPRELAPFVPCGVELDTWNGGTYVSIVGFRFLNTRIGRWRIPGHSDFEEVNLRLYVRRAAPEGWRRGVVFIREIVPKRLIAFTARAVYNERYVAMPMRHDHRNGNLRYEWRYGGRWQTIQASVSGSPNLPEPGSQEEFIAEHYWGYVATRDGGCSEYRVEHPPWLVWSVADATFCGDPAPYWGSAFAAVVQRQPASVFVAEGSAVTVYRGTTLEAR